MRGLAPHTTHHTDPNCGPGLPSLQTLALTLNLTQPLLVAVLAHPYRRAMRSPARGCVGTRLLACYAVLGSVRFAVTVAEPRATHRTHGSA